MLSRFEPVAFAALRIVSGICFSLHGAQKLFGIMGGQTHPIGSQLWIGAVIELTTGALIAVGWFARPAAFLASGTMAVAYLQFHWKLRFDDGLWSPLTNKGELALLYSFVWLYIVARGAGRFALRPSR